MKIFIQTLFFTDISGFVIINNQQCTYNRQRRLRMFCRAVSTAIQITDATHKRLFFQNLHVTLIWRYFVTKRSWHLCKLWIKAKTSWITVSILQYSTVSSTRSMFSMGNIAKVKYIWWKLMKLSISAPRPTNMQNVRCEESHHHLLTSWLVNYTKRLHSV